MSEAISARDVTVAIAACGHTERLVVALEALLDGVSRPGAVMVVDQQPSDEARAAVHRVDSSIRYVEQGRLGLSASRNLALELASTPILAVTDDDCVPDPGWLSALVEATNLDPLPAAVTGPVFPLGPKPEGEHGVSLRTSHLAQDHVGRVLPWVVGSGANLAARREDLLAVGGWDERLGTGTPGRAAEDADLHHRLLRSGAIVRYVPDAVVRHPWQPWDVRLRRRASYAFGAGALSGIWIRRGDAFAVRMLAAYGWMHLRDGLLAVWARDRDRAREHRVALLHLPAGLWYGLRQRPDRSRP